MRRLDAFAIGSALLGGAVYAAGPAQAAPLFTINNTSGFTATLPSLGSLSPNPNDIIKAANGFTGGASLVEGSLSADPGTVQVWYLGKEAAWTNTLNTPGGSKANTPNNTTLQVTQAAITSTAPTLTFNHAGGLLDVDFTSSGVGVIPAWNNQAVPSGNQDRGVIFGYLEALGAWNLVSFATNVVVFGFDDSGQGKNDNHDDWVGIAYVTPIPGAAWLFAPALAGLGLLRRRKVVRTGEPATA